MGMHLYRLTLGILAVWRLTHLLHAENGPWNLFDHLRRRCATGFWSSLLGCFYCLSLWVAAPFTLLATEGWGERLLLWPALSAGAILLERFSTRAAAAPAAYFEEEEKNDVLLRKDDGEPAAGIAFHGSRDGRIN
jgi:type VI protein secretion system component VasK